MSKKVECGFGHVPDAYKDEFRLSPSKIKDSLESMKLYKWRLDRKIQPTAAMELGTLLHMAILEPERFAKTYVKPPKIEKYVEFDQVFVTAYQMADWLAIKGQKKSGKKEELIVRIKEFISTQETKENVVFWDEVMASAIGEGQILMTDKEDEQATETLREIDNQPFTKWLTQNGEREKRMWFREPETGVIISMIIDFFSMGVGSSTIPVVMDVKKVPDVKLFKMQRWLDDTKTGVQLAINRDCIKHITGIEPKCMVLALDAKEPYNVVPYTLDPAVLEISEYKYKQQIVQILDAHRDNKFQGFSDGTPISLNFPHYVLQREELNEDEIVHDLN